MFSSTTLSTSSDQDDGTEFIESGASRRPMMLSSNDVQVFQNIVECHMFTITRSSEKKVEAIKKLFSYPRSLKRSDKQANRSPTEIDLRS